MSQKHWKWCGMAHHFIAADRCGFHLATFVGDFLISTVGDYRPDGGKRETLGWGEDSYFETYVFNTDGNHDNEERHPKVLDFIEIDGERCATVEAANEMHFAYCKKYDKKKVSR